MNHSTSYDDVPYRSFPYANSHPDHLATIARIFGIDAADISSARILELGCGCAGNLIPVAATYPRAGCVGMDLSGTQIAIGRQAAQALQLRNIELIQANLQDFEVEPESFDYVICHGVFSWVAPHIRKRILALIRSAMKKRGVAYVSFNTYPGWHLRQSIREMMLYHCQGFEEPQLRVNQARALLDFLIASATDSSATWHTLLRDELLILQHCSDSYLFHEHLEDQNQPIYFHEFAAAAQQAGLRFLGDADFSSMVATNLGSDVAATLQQIATDIIQMEQYHDFIRNRMFRCTLLCQQEVCPERHVTENAVTPLWIATPLTFTPADSHSDQPAFLSADGHRISVNSSHQTAALKACIQAWPEALPVRQLTPTGTDADSIPMPQHKTMEKEIKQMILSLFTKGLVELHSVPSPFTSQVSERNTAFSYARYQAEHSQAVTTLRHTTVHLNDLQRRVLRLLDGKHTIDTVVAELIAACKSGDLTAISPDGTICQNAAQLHAALTAAARKTLEFLAAAGLLVKNNAPPSPDTTL